VRDENQEGDEAAVGEFVGSLSVAEGMETGGRGGRVGDVRGLQGTPADGEGGEVQEAGVLE